MKNLLSIAFFLICITTYPQNSNKFVITGTLEDVVNAKATLDYNRIPVEIINGAFTLTSEISDPRVVRFMISEERLSKTTKSGGYYPVKSMHIWIILYPGAKIDIKGNISDFADAYAYDGGENDILSGFHKELFPLLNSSVNIDLRLDYEKDSLSTIDIEKLTKEKETLNNKAQALRISFLEDHVSSLAGLWLMDDMVIRSQIEMTEVERLFGKVDKRYNSLSYYLSLEARVKGYKATQVGQVAPDISTISTPDSSLFSLESMRGKYVILDFWGTWCGPCVQGIPHMKEFRDKHADKLQIVGVAQDRDYKMWKNFVVGRKMDWPNVLVGKGEEDFVLKYNVQGFPTKLLLSPEGIILYRASGEEESFYEEIEKIINTK